MTSERLRLGCLVLFVAFLGCAQRPWNDPYAGAGAEQNTLYSGFRERPKHFDPVSSYSENEYLFIQQIYEPPLQYHYLKRPYQLIPLTARRVPEPVYLNALGEPVSGDIRGEDVTFSVYRISIKPEIYYQPHPAFAQSANEKYLYHSLSISDLSGIHTIADFPQAGTRELIAKDYVYQIKRLAHPRLHSPLAGLMNRYIVGLKEFAETLKAIDSDNGERYIDLSRYPLEGARAIDKYTLEIKVKGRYPQFIYWLAMPFFAAMPWEADRFYSQPGMAEKNVILDWYPVGTGPFMLTENNPNRRIVLVKNPNFRGEPYPAVGEPGDRELGLLTDAGKLMPFIDRIIFNLEKEAIPTWSKFLQGYYDSSGIGSDSFDQAIQFNFQGEAELTAEMRKRGIKLLTSVETSTFYTGFNMLDDVVGGDSERARKLRQAIAIAMHYEEYVSIFANGRGIAAQGPIPPGIFGHRDGEEGINPYVYDWVSGKPKRKSIQEARRLLAEAGYPKGRDARTGKPLLLYFDTALTGPDAKANLDWIRKQFRRLRIKLVIRTSDYNRFQDKMRKGTAQIFQWGWNADYPDPENFLFLLYGPNGKVKDHGENASNYANPDFDHLFVQVKNMENGSERQRIIDRMVDIARRDAPWVWGFHPVQFSLHHAWYHNAKPMLMSKNTLKYKRVDPGERGIKQAQWNQPVVWPLGIVFGVLVIALIPAVLSYRRKEHSSAL